MSCTENVDEQVEKLEVQMGVVKQQKCPATIPTEAIATQGLS